MTSFFDVSSSSLPLVILVLQAFVWVTGPELSGRGCILGRMRDRELYARILGIQPPWRVRDVEHLEAGEVHVFIAAEGAAFQCPRCGKDSQATTAGSGVGGTWTAASTGRF